MPYRVIIVHSYEDRDFSSWDKDDHSEHLCIDLQWPSKHWIPPLQGSSIQVFPCPLGWLIRTYHLFSTSVDHHWWFSHHWTLRCASCVFNEGFFLTYCTNARASSNVRSVPKGVIICYHNWEKDRQNKSHVVINQKCLSDNFKYSCCFATKYLFFFFCSTNLM